MPELPEIETLARGLRKAVRHNTISQVEVLDTKTWRVPQSQINKYLVGARVTTVRRRAKWLIIDLSSEHSFIIHLKMTGQLLFEPALKKANQAPKPIKHTAYFLGGHSMSGGRSKSEPKSDIPLDAAIYPTEPKYPNQHTRAVIYFTDHSVLYFNDQRKFGYIELLPTEKVADYFAAKKLGREPIERNYTFAYFNDQLTRRSRTTIKAAILDQTVIAGIGNIYADDSLYMARIHPGRRVDTLTQPERRALYKATTAVLHQAIAAGGTSFSDYHQLDGTLGQYWKKRKVYQRTGQPCKRCKTPIKKIRLAGRGTHYCPTCQQ